MAEAGLGGGEGNCSVVYLGVVDSEFCAFIKKIFHDEGCGGLSGVSGIFLEGESEDGDSFSCYSVEHRTHDFVCESSLLVVVHKNYLVPVVGTLLETEGFADINQVEDVLLEA